METVPPIWVNLLILTGFVEEDLREQIEALKAKGATGVEIPFFDGSVEHYRTIGEMLKSLGLGASAVTVSDPENDPSSLDEEIRQAGVAKLREKIEWAGALRRGCGQDELVLCGPLALPWGEEPQVDGEPVRGQALVEHAAQRIAQAVKSFEVLGRYAMCHGVKLAIEPITHWEIFALTRLCEVVKFVESIDDPSVGVHIDMSHETLDGDGPEVFRKLVAGLVKEGKLFHFHVSPPDRGRLAECWLPWDDMFGMLQAASYPGPLVIEVFNAEEPFATGCRLTRAPYEDPIEEIGQAISYIIERWKNVNHLSIMQAEAALRSCGAGN